MSTRASETEGANPSLCTETRVEQRLAELLAQAAQFIPPPKPEPTYDPLPPTPPYKQELDAGAFHGPAGRIVRVLAPHSEAHPAALLLQLLAAFGNLIGSGPHCMVESTRHRLNLFVVLVGDSSKGRKGTSWNLVANLFADLDPAWLTTRVNCARLNAIGLVQALRDQDPPTDRRLLILAEEFAGTLRSFKGSSGHLGPLLRGAWDSGNLPTFDMRQQLRASNTHVSLIAHITQHELAQTFHRTEAYNGFANRCLWTWVERSNCLPHASSPPPDELSLAAAPLRDAVRWATERPEILFRRDEAANQLWEEYYSSISDERPGLRGAATSRGEAQVLRLSALYAALDCSEIIELAHLKAAIAVWAYCYISATRLFGMSTGDPIADRIREAIEASHDGLTRRQINGLLHGHVHSDRIDEALNQLAFIGAITGRTYSSGGRPATLYSVADPNQTQDDRPDQTLERDLVSLISTF
jgi:hypothetical protein